MPTPLVHLGAAGVILAMTEVTARRPLRNRDRAAIVLACVAPDLDFLPGIAIGDPTRFHRLITHTLLVAALMGAACALLTRGRLIAVLTLAGVGHVLLDSFTVDTLNWYGPNTSGMTLLWPLSTAEFGPYYALFTSPYVGFDWDKLLSYGNFTVFAWELPVFLTGALLWAVAYRRTQTQTPALQR